jgi:hypothetical protein
VKDKRFSNDNHTKDLHHLVEVIVHRNRQLIDRFIDFRLLGIRQRDGLLELLVLYCCEGSCRFLSQPRHSLIM